MRSIEHETAAIRRLLPRFLEPEGYRACDWDLRTRPADRDFWVQYFVDHAQGLRPLIAESYPHAGPADVERFLTGYTAALLEVAARPGNYPRIDILLLDEIHALHLEGAGFPDPYLALKRRANEAAFALLPALLREYDALDAGLLPERLVLGLLAGNLFDMGAPNTAALYAQRGDSFAHALAELKPRPWFVDRVDDWIERWARRPYAHVAFFVDNSGSDFVLGALPLIRWMLQHGTRVTVVANERAALNDVTFAEAGPLLERFAAVDDVAAAAALRSGRLACVSSGTGAPLVDLATLDPTCCAGTADADLVILHGMGRAVESNWTARFRVDSLRSALIKEPAVAKYVGADTYDCVFRFEPTADRTR